MQGVKHQVLLTVQMLSRFQVYSFGLAKRLPFIFALEVMESMKKTKEIEKMGLKNKTLHQINSMSALRVH